MEKFYLTIDTGTTNSRAVLWRENCPIDEFMDPTGVRDTAMDGDNRRLKAAVKGLIDQLMATHKLEWDQITIIASGMITSNVGLYELPHLIAPVNMAELAAGMKWVDLFEVAAVPIWFVPGIKNDCSVIILENVENMDIMRGEETEAFALLDKLEVMEAGVFIMPGSHTKFVEVNASGSITGCLTTLTGELLACLTNNTIIADAVNKQFVTEQDFDEKLAIAGYCQTKSTGLSRTVFLTRILKLFTDYNKMQLASFLLGCVLFEDIRALENSHILHINKDVRIVLAGKGAFQRALGAILCSEGYNHVLVLDQEIQRNMSGYGACRLAQIRGV